MRYIPSCRQSALIALFLLFAAFGFAEDSLFPVVGVYPLPPTVSTEQEAEIERRALAGDPRHQLYYGALYANGHYGKIRFDLAKEWYERAAAQGNRRAKRNLAVLLQHGIGVEKDERAALRLYIEAAEQGDAAALLGISTYFFANKIALTNEQLRWPLD